MATKVDRIAALEARRKQKEDRIPVLEAELADLVTLVSLLDDIAGLDLQIEDLDGQIKELQERLDRDA